MAFDSTNNETGGAGGTESKTEVVQFCPSGCTVIEKCISCVSMKSQRKGYKINGIQGPTISCKIVEPF